MRLWRFDRRYLARISGADMAMGRIRSLWTVINSAIDGGARAWEAERRAEQSRLTFREGRAVPQHIAIIMAQTPHKWLCFACRRLLYDFRIASGQQHKMTNYPSVFPVREAVI